MKRIAVLLLILFLVVIGFIIINCVITRKDTIKEWNVIKEDYEIINNRAIKYANENLGNGTTHILIGIGEEAFKDLSEREKDALENIKNYYKYQRYIMIYQDTIEYGDETGYFVIIYSRTGEEPIYEDRHIEHLTGNWYKAYVN